MSSDNPKYVVVLRSNIPQKELNLLEHYCFKMVSPQDEILFYFRCSEIDVSHHSYIEMKTYQPDSEGVPRSIAVAPTQKYRLPLHATVFRPLQAHCAVLEFPHPCRPSVESKPLTQFLADKQPICYTVPEEKPDMARRARLRRIKRIGLLCS